MQNSTIAHLRLRHQQIAAPTFETPGEVVRWLGAVQAQDYRAALWAVGLRMRHATEAIVEQALADRTIVRTWPMRGTLHFVPAADARWMLALLTPRVVAGAAARARELGLDDATFERGKEAFGRALQGGKQLSREGMYAVLEAAGIATAGQRGIHIIGRLAQQGVLCFGAREGKQPTFTLLDEWVPAARALQPDEALAELALRYFTSHGPATVYDLMWWSGLTAGKARAAIELAQARLARMDVGGKPHWMALDASVGEPLPSVHLLPAYDEYMLGYRDRSAVLDAGDATRIVPGNNGVFRPIIVVDGQIKGIWKRTPKKDAVMITPEPFALLSEAEAHAFAIAAHQYGAFLGLPVTDPPTP